MTPSGWHDDARSRDAGHDELQASVYRWLGLHPAPDRTEEVDRPPKFIGYKTWTYKWARDGLEVAFTKEGRICCFADVCRTFNRSEQWHGLEHPQMPRPMAQCYDIFEIKPKIYSVGAILRQAFATTLAIKQSAPGSEVNVTVVAPWNDPKIALARDMGVRLMPWKDGAPFLRGGDEE